MSAALSWLDLLIDPVRRAAGHPGVSVMSFPSRIDVVLSSLPVDQGTTITFPDPQNECRVNAIYFLSGFVDIHLGDGSVGAWRPQTACLLRNDTPGFRLVARESGLLSHVCISMCCADLAKRFPDGAPPFLGDFLNRRRKIVRLRPLSITPAMTTTALTLHESGLHDPLEWSRCEPVALQFLLEALAALQNPPPEDEVHAAGLLEQARALHKAVADDPSIDLVNVLGQCQPLRQQREVLRAFESCYGISLRTYRQRVAMAKARDALTDGALIKQLAYDMGYTHVANFTRAYRRAFGESPSQTLRRRSKP